jgi:hypothetical protein
MIPANCQYQGFGDGFSFFYGYYYFIRLTGYG